MERMRAMLQTEEEPRALAVALQAVREAEHAVPVDPERVAEARVALAECYLGERRHAEALAELDGARRAFERVPGRTLQRLAELRDLEGISHEELGDDDAAEQCFLASLKLREAHVGRDHPEVATSLEHLARLYGDGHFEDRQAVPLLTRALRILEHAGEGCDHRRVRVLHDLAVLHRNAGDVDAARDLLEDALRIQVELAGRDDDSIAPLLRDLALAYAEKQEWLTVEALLRRALAILDAHPVEQALPYIEDLADAERESGNVDRSLSLYRHAARLYRAAHGPDDVEAAEIEQFIDDLERRRRARRDAS
jgi:tetratricopeptide (TPR) repeat protein